MKRYGYNAVKEELKNRCWIRLNTMPFRSPTYPDIALMGFDEDAEEVVMGSVSSPTFFKLLDNGDIRLKQRHYGYDVFWNDDYMSYSDFE